MSTNEYVIPSGKYKGLKTRAKTLEDAQSATIYILPWMRWASRIVLHV